MANDLDLIDKLLADYKKPEDIIGENGLLKRLTSRLHRFQKHRLALWATITKTTDFLQVCITISSATSS